VIGSVAVIIGTYRGASDGQLSVTACAGDRCQGGTGDLASAGDNLPLEIGLDAPLPIHAGEDLRLRFGHDGGTEPVAIWSYPQSAGLARGPGLVVTYQTADLPLAHVYSDRVLDIYEMADPAPYFETVGGPCRISAARREAVTTDCAAPARLIRRELFFDGWSATIDRRPVAIMPEGRLLQAVDVPAGTARIRFRYAPPFARASAAAFALGLVLLVAGLRPGPRQGSALDLPGGRGPLDPATR
jgi:hypothetical protein